MAWTGAVLLMAGRVAAMTWRSGWLARWRRRTATPSCRTPRARAGMRARPSRAAMKPWAGQYSSASTARWGVNPACWKAALVAARQQPASHLMSIHGSAAVSLSVMTRLAARRWPRGMTTPDRVAQQGPVAQGAVCGGGDGVGLDHGEVDHAAAEHAERVVAFGHAQADLQPRERGADPGQCRGDEFGPGGGERGQPQRAGLARVQSGERRFGLGQAVQDGGGVTGQQPPGRGGPDPSPGGLQQHGPGFAFQRGDVLADRRGCVAEAGGGVLDRPGGHHGVQGLQAAQIKHRYSNA